MFIAICKRCLDEILVCPKRRHTEDNFTARTIVSSRRPCVVFSSVCWRSGPCTAILAILLRRSTPTVACWILRTNSTSDLLRSQAIEDSWGKYCNTVDFIDKQTPGIKADWFEVYEDIAAKSYRAWNFMYRKYLRPELQQAPLVDFILKADVDSYIIGPNMLEYLVRFDPDKPYYIGKNFVDLNGKHFVAGTAIILSREALRTWHAQAHQIAHLISFENTSRLKI